VSAIARAEAGGAGSPPPEVLWHEVECGRYRADLPLWRELAAAAVPPGASAAAVLDLGAGSGRVALDLAAAGHDVTALDRSPALLAELARRAGALPIQTVLADVRGFELERKGFDLCLVPMQTLQLMRGAREREALFAAVAGHVRQGAVLACAIVGEVDEFDSLGGELGPSPDRMRLNDAEYLSRPLLVQLRGGVIRIERERIVLPVDGSAASPGAPEHDVIELECVTAEQLWAEARPNGLRGEPSRWIPETDEHSASEVVMFRA
jgi:SAM-dependent methyltransferase